MRVVVKETKEVRDLKELKVDIGRDGKEYYLTIIPNTEIVDPISKSLCTPLIEQITSLDEYQKLAARTLPDLQEYYGSSTVTIKNIENLTCNDIHVLYGITTELIEILDLYKKSFAYRKPFDKTNLLEEICDKIWYVAGGCTVNNTDLNSIIDLDTIGYNGFCIPMGDFPTIENMKDVFDIADNYNNGIVDIEDVLASFVSSEEELFRGLTNNINKLIIRYPDKFSNESALNRDLNSEREQLEQ